MSVRSDKSKQVDVSDPASVLSEAAATDAALGEGNAYCELTDERTKTFLPLFPICAECPCFNSVCRRREPRQSAEGE